MLELVDIDLSRDEDSVTTLAISHSTESSVTALAGINSSTADQNAGKNEHLRSFRLDHPPKKGARGDDLEKRKQPVSSYKGETKALGRTSLFVPSTATKKETYQRILRLSERNERSGTRLGAVATGLAPEGEIVVFIAGLASPGKDDVCGRLRLGKGAEAEDVDIVYDVDEDYRIAYCTDYEVYLATVSSRRGDKFLESHLLHSSTPSKVRPKFRSLRFLTPDLLLLLQNQPDRTGAELLLLEISTASPTGTVLLRKCLHKSIKSATAFSVTPLYPSDPEQNTQHAIAIAGSDLSITILTLDRPSALPFGRPQFRKHSVLKDVHPLQITSLTFSTFHFPTTAPKDIPPQYLKLASTSFANTAVVHTLPLKPYPPPSSKSSKPRYVLVSPGRSESAQLTFSIIISALVIALGAFLLQAFTEIRGGTPEYLGAKGWLSERVHGYIARPYMFEDLSTQVPQVATPPTQRVSEVVEDAGAKVVHAAEKAEGKVEHVVDQAKHKLRLRDILPHRQNPSHHAHNKDIIIRHSPSDDPSASSLSTELRNPNEIIKDEHNARKWEELEAHEKETWKKRLVDAGEWSVAEGEAVLKGVLFSGYSQVIGQAVGEALAGAG